MKKRLLPLLLVVALLVAAAVLSVSATEDEKCPCGCGQSLSEIEWLDWNATNAAAIAAKNAEGKVAHYRLNVEKLETSAKIDFGGSKNPHSFTLDLNGHTWTNKSTYLMHIGLGASNPCTVNIFDSVGGGELQGYGTNNSAGVIYIANGSKLVLHSGTIRQLENASSQTRGAVYMLNGGKMEMKGGKITDGYTISNSGTTGTVGVAAGNLMVRYDAEFTMSGGEITGGYSKYQAGGVGVLGGTFTMTGGKIYGNTTDGDGANLLIKNRGDTDSNKNIYPITATIGGTAEITNGNVYCSDNNLTVSGTPVISELKIAEGKTITLGGLTDGANICVNATGAFTATNENASDYVGYFKTNVAGHEVVAEGNVLKLAEVPNATCPCCGKYRDEIKWMTWNQKNAQDTTKPGAENNNLIKDENGIVHYQLQADIVTGKYVFGNADNNINFTLDLNGYTWRSDDNYLMHIGSDTSYPVEVNIFDSVGDGELQAYGTANEAGVVTVRNGSKLVLHSGTIRQLYKADSTTRGTVFLWNGTMEMKGGKITDGYTTSTEDASAGNVSLRGTATFTMSGGEITNGYATKLGGGVAVVGGTFTMSGGKISNNITLGNGGNVMVGGSGSATFSGDVLIEKGVAGGKGGNIYNASTSMTLNNVSGNNDSGIKGDIYSTQSVTLTGVVNIPMGNSNGIELYGGKQLKFTNFTKDGSLIYFGLDWQSADAVGKLRTITAAGGAAYKECIETVGNTISLDNYVNNGTVTEILKVEKGGEGAVSYCPHCKDEVTWSLFSNLATATGDHFIADSTSITQSKFTANKTIVLDLAGKVISNSQNSSAFYLETDNCTINLAILDTVGGGKLTSGASSVGFGGILAANNASRTINFELFSGTLTGTSQRGGVVGVYKGAVTIHGGIIRDSKATSQNGGAVWLNGTNTSFTMHAGLITNCSATSNSGGSVYATGPVTIDGGIIQGGKSKNAGGNIFINSAATHSISNAVIRGGETTATCGGNIGITNSKAKLSLKNVTLAGGVAATYGGSISMDAAGTLDLDNVFIYDGTAGTTGGNIAITAGALKMDSVTVLGGKSNGGNGGNIYYESTTAILWDNLTVANGIAGGTSSAGGNIYYKSAASATISDSKIYNGSSTGNAGNLAAMVNTTLINCEIKNGRSKVVWNEETQKYETATDRINERSDNIFANRNITLDGVLITGDSDLGEMGTGVYAVNKVTLMGETVIGNPKTPLSASLYLKPVNGSSPSLEVDASFTGKVTISSYNLLEDGYRSEPYGAILLNASYNGEFTGKLYVDNHVPGSTSNYKTWEIGMPEIFPIADGKLRVAAAMIRNGQNKTCYETVAMALEAYNYDKGDLLQLGMGEKNLTLSEGNYRVDLFGNQVGVTATGKVNIEGVDRKNYNADDDEFNAAGMLEILSDDVDVTVSKSASFDGDQYVAIKNGDIYDFHYISMDITKVTLRTSNAGIYYQGTWKCDPVLEAYIQENLNFGVVLNASEKIGADFNTKKENRYTVYSGEKFLSGEVYKGAILADIMVVGEETNAGRCAMQIHATPYLYLGKEAGVDKFIVGSENVSMSLMDVFKKLDQALQAGSGITQDEKAEKTVEVLMQEFYEKWCDDGLDVAIKNYASKEVDPYNFTKIFQESA